MRRARAFSQLSACLKGRVPRDPDWEAILALANECWVPAELYPLVEKAVAPRDVRAFIGEVYERNLRRNAELFGTLGDALIALNRVGIEPVLLKGCAGWAVAEEVVEAPLGGRILADIDLLAPPNLLEESAQALISAGFQLLEDCRSKTHHPGMVLWRRGDRGTIDLHQFTPGPRGLAPLENIASLSRRVRIAGAYAKAPPSELQILINVLHDQLLDGHYWRGGFNLRHLIDIASLSHQHQAPNWQAMYAICRQAGLHSLMSAQLLAAANFAGARIPTEARRDLMGQLHCRRQTLQFVWPLLNMPFHMLGLNVTVWRGLSSRPLREFV